MRDVVLVVSFVLSAMSAGAIRGQSSAGTPLASFAIDAEGPIEVVPTYLRIGVPLGRDADVHDVAKLALVDDASKPVAVQLSVLSRWDGPASDTSRPIKWIEATFAARGKRGDRYTIVEAERIRGDVTLTETDRTLVLSNSSLTVELLKGSLDLFGTVRLGDDVVTGAPSGRVLFTGEDGTPADLAPWKIVVVSADDAALNILASTRAYGLDIEWRLRMVSGCDELVSDIRVINRGPYGHMESTSAHVWFKRLGVLLPCPSGPCRIATPFGWMPETSDREDAYALLQTHRTSPKGPPPSERLPFEVWSGKNRMRVGERANGVLALEREGMSMGVGVERFWENAPKTLLVSSGRLCFDLFPEGGSGPLYGGLYGEPGGKGDFDDRARRAWRFEGARAKTARLRLRFGRESAEGLAIRLDRSVADPIHALADPAHIVATGAIGYPYDLARPRTSDIGARFEQLMRILVDDGAADPQATIGQIGLPGFIERGGTYGFQSFYGWFDFGDIAWGDGYCSLHYDWPLVMLLNYVRSGDVRYFERGSDMAHHRADIDQDHDTTSTHHLRGGQFYEKGYWHGNYYHPVASHTWVGGLIVHWFLTGDEASAEAAKLCGEFIRRQSIDHWDGRWGIRIPGWAAESMLWLWFAFGEQRDLDHARAILRRVEVIEQKKYGGKGYIINEEMKPKSEQPWMMNIYFNAAARERWLTGSDKLVPFMGRMTKFFRERCIVERSGQGPLLVYRHVSPKEQVDPDIHLAWPMAASFAWRYYIERDPADLTMARKLFDGVVRWPQGVKDGGYSPIAFRMLNYPNAESKIHSNIGIWGLPVTPLLEGR